MSSGPDSAPVEGAAIQRGDTAVGPAGLSAEEAMLLDKYRQERARRMRADGTAQYRKTEGDLARFFLTDPAAEPQTDRQPIDEEIDVVVVGGGWSGILTAVRLVQAGVTSLRIIESGGGFGGVWYWNRYPGARCDVESYIYIPLLEETGYVQAQKYAAGPEIRAQVEAVATRFDLYPKALFQTRVTEVRWDDSTARWIASTSRGDTIRARFAFVGNSQLNYPKLPAIPGAEDFRGHSFHSSRWDYAYTGGAAHAHCYRGPGQPAHQSRMGGQARTRLAKGPHGQLRAGPYGPRRGKPRRRRVDALLGGPLNAGPRH
jgi:hypothetical protein